MKKGHTLSGNETVAGKKTEKNGGVNATSKPGSIRSATESVVAKSSKGMLERKQSRRKTSRQGQQRQKWKLCKSPKRTRKNKTKRKKQDLKNGM